MKLSPISILILSSYIYSAGAVNENESLSQSEVPEQLAIIAYCTPTAEQMSVERFKEMVEAGFSAGIPAERNHDIDSMEAMLDLAQEAGMQLFVNCREMLEDPEGTALHFRDHPAVAGYFIIDEPSWSEDGWEKTEYVAIPVRNLALGEIVDSIKSVDPERPSYINLFPNVASPQQLGTSSYRAYVQNFLDEVPGAEFVSFDHYPIANYQIRDAWYENLEIVSSLARERDIPFWAFALSSTHYAYTPATAAQLKMQMYINLAYGAQALQYFPYWAPNSAHWFAPIEYDGNRSYLFQIVKDLNIEIQKHAPIFKGATVLNVGHTGTQAQWRPGNESSPESWEYEKEPLPPGTQQYQPESPVTQLLAQGKNGAVVSTLQKGAYRYLAVVNKDYAHMLVLRLNFDGSREIDLFEETGTWQALNDLQFRTLIQPGDMAILRWQHE